MNAPRGTMSDGFAFPSLTPVVKVLLIALVGSYLALWIVGLCAPTLANEIAGLLVLDHGAWFKAPLFLPLWQLATMALVHGDLMHLLGNCLVLYFFGTMVEEIVASRRFAWLFGLGLLAASVASLVLMRYVAPDAISLGASGGVMAVVAAAATFRPHSTVILLLIPLPLWVLAVGYVAFDALPAIEALVGRGGGGGVDHFAHLGGALFGFLSVKRGFIWVDWQARFQKIVAQRVERSAAEDDAELDRLLARVGKEGIHALTDRERAFLRRMAERKSGGRR